MAMTREEFIAALDGLSGAEHEGAGSRAQGHYDALLAAFDEQQQRIATCEAESARVEAEIHELLRRAVALMTPAIERLTALVQLRDAAFQREIADLLLGLLKTNGMDCGAPRVGRS